jgi:hypothetical protein
MAQGNLSNQIDQSRDDEMGAMMVGLKHMQERLAGTVRSVREGSDAIATASSEIAAGNLDRRAARNKLPVWKKPRPRWKNSPPPCGRIPRMPQVPVYLASSARDCHQGWRAG